MYQNCLYEHRHLNHIFSFRGNYYYYFYHASWKISSKIDFNVSVCLYVDAIQVETKAGVHESSPILFNTELNLKNLTLHKSQSWGRNEDPNAISSMHMHGSLNITKASN